MASRAFLSVIIPTYNEQDNLDLLLKDLKSQVGIELEIFVCDGQSTDSTAQIARSHEVYLMTNPRRRSIQMNAGARLAKSDYLFFVHADSRIPYTDQLKKAFDQLTTAEQVALNQSPLKPRPKDQLAGHFPLKFVRQSNKNSKAYRYPEEKSALGRPHSINGDQGLMISAKFFKDLEGFNEELPFMEDQDLAEKIRIKGQWLTFDHKILTSARRFESEGFHKRYILMSIMTGLYWTGVHSFFTRAPSVYRLQDQTKELKMWPFWQVIWLIMRKDLGFWGSLGTWYRVGRYIRQNSWQMFFFFDVSFRDLLGPDRYPFLWFHDRIFWPLTNHRLGDVINSIICFTWFMLILGPYFYVAEFTNQYFGHREKSHP